jgi:hypothetical protein
MLGDANLLELVAKCCAAEQRDIDQRAVDLGGRSAEERVTHLIVDLIERMSRHGVRPNYPYPFPLLHRQIADLTGLYARSRQPGDDGIPQCRAVEVVEGIAITDLAPPYLTAGARSGSADPSVLWMTSLVYHRRKGVPRGYISGRKICAVVGLRRTRGARST